MEIELASLCTIGRLLGFSATWKLAPAIVLGLVPSDVLCFIRRMCHHTGRPLHCSSSLSYHAVIIVRTFFCPTPDSKL